MDPNSGTALTTLGWVYHKNGRPLDAERVLRAALSSGPVSSDAAYYLARVLADRGREADVAPLLKLSLGAPGRFAFRTEARVAREGREVTGLGPSETPYTRQLHMYATQEFTSCDSFDVGYPLAFWPSPP